MIRREQSKLTKKSDAMFHSHLDLMVFIKIVYYCSVDILSI